MKPGNRHAVCDKVPIPAGLMTVLTDKKREYVHSGCQPSS
ncbi:hypothetical protein BBOR36S_01952 [Brevibacillus borstelensis]